MTTIREFTYFFEEVECMVAGRVMSASGEVEIVYNVGGEILPSGRTATTVDWEPCGDMRVELADENGDVREVTLNKHAILYHDIIGRCEDDIADLCHHDATEGAW